MQGSEEPERTFDGELNGNVKMQGLIREVRRLKVSSDC
jgi:hypothetical protein